MATESSREWIRPDGIGRRDAFQEQRSRWVSSHLASVSSSPSVQPRRAARRPPDRSRSTPMTSAAWSRAEGTRGRRLGDRRDDRAADPVRADRRHRRPGPLPDARPAEGEVQRLGARLRPRRFAEGPGRARAAPLEPHRGAGADAPRPRAVLPGDLLVLDAEDSRRRASSAARATFPRSITQDRLAEPGEEHRLHRLPPARPARRRARSRRVPRHVRSARRRRGCAASSPARPASR